VDFSMVLRLIDTEVKMGLSPDCPPVKIIRHKGAEQVLNVP
jgi:hypothetical protein